MLFRSKGAKTLTGGAVIYWWFEVIAVLTYYVVYSAVRNADAAHPEVARRHALELIGWQRDLGIYHELAIHKWARGIEPLIVSANYFYGSLHFVVTIGVAVYLFAKWPDDYPRWRNTLAISTAIALIAIVCAWNAPLVPALLVLFPLSAIAQLAMLIDSYRVGRRRQRFPPGIAGARDRREREARRYRRYPPGSPRHVPR